MIHKLNFLKHFLFFTLLLSAGHLFGQYEIGYKERGNAAYYADKLHGRPTASGELYDKNAYTTAHKTLPFGTIIKVTNLENNKTVNVKVNDRGPFQPNKMVDLSRAAAEQIDLIKKGVVMVEIEILGDDAITLPDVNNTAQANIDFNAPAISRNDVATANTNTQAILQNQSNQQQINNTIPETQPYNPVTESKNTRDVLIDVPQTSALTAGNTIQASPASIEIDQVGFVQRGKAIFYPGNRSGKVTVTGEEYNMNQLIAAHPNIQLNSIVKVTNLDNGNMVMVRINDRPSTQDLNNETVIALSLKAAETLGLTEQGTADVKLEVINTGNAIEAPVTAVAKNSLNNNIIEQEQQLLTAEEIVANRTQTLAGIIQPVNTYDLNGNIKNLTGFGIQVASYNNQLNAVEKALEFEKLQFNQISIQAGWSNGQKSYRVLIGDFVSKEAAQPLVEFLKSKELNPFLRKHMEPSNNN